MMPYKRFLAVCVTLLVLFAFLGPVWGQEAEMVNINKASAQELAKLEKVGPKYAVRIVEYRHKYGPFKLTEELMEIPGIGPGTYNRIKDQIIAQ
jgi:competence ComEA-like helix-hairpin-helix protein